MDQDGCFPMHGAAVGAITARCRGRGGRAPGPEIDAVLWMIVERAMNGDFPSRGALEEEVFRQIARVADIKPNPPLAPKVSDAAD